MGIKWGKPIEDMDGNPARVLSDNYRLRGAKTGTYVVQVEFDTYSNLLFVYADGGNFADGVQEIRNKRVKHEAWQNIYRNYKGEYIGGSFYKSEELAREAFREANGITTVKVEWEE